MSVQLYQGRETAGSEPELDLEFNSFQVSILWHNTNLISEKPREEFIKAADQAGREGISQC